MDKSFLNFTAKLQLLRYARQVGRTLNIPFFNQNKIFSKAISNVQITRSLTIFLFLFILFTISLWAKQKALVN